MAVYINGLKKRTYAMHLDPKEEPDSLLSRRSISKKEFKDRREFSTAPFPDSPNGKLP
jgi:hypothetical protein